MSIHQSTLRVRIGRYLVLQLDRYAREPGRSYDDSYWTGAIWRGCNGTHRRLAFACVHDRSPRMSSGDDDAAVWVGSAAFDIPANQRARIQEWIAANEQPNAREEGADRTVSAGASHAGRDSAAGKPGDVNGAQQRTPPIEEGPRDLLRAGGSAAPPAGMQGSPLPVATVGVAS